MPWFSELACVEPAIAHDVKTHAFTVKTKCAAGARAEMRQRRVAHGGVPAAFLLCVAHAACAAPERVNDTEALSAVRNLGQDVVRVLAIRNAYACIAC
eukprot:1191399-Prymnesium_polylepis.1